LKKHKVYVEERHEYVVPVYDIDNAPTVELDECIIQEVLNKRCMTAVANEYLVALHGTRPQGEWIVDYQENEDALFKHGWKCPVCEERNTYGMPPYCMYCGAKLEKADGQK
jgi:hypothetical protein